MVQNQFAGGYQVNEKLPDSIENNDSTDSLVDLDGKSLQLNGGGIYQSFSEQREKNSELGEKEKPESSSQYFPILKNLFESKHIDEDLFKKTTEKFNEINEGEELSELLKIVNNLSDNKVKNDILKSFDKKEATTEKNFEKTDFFKDSSVLNIDLDKGVGGLEIMLADNYISINNKDGTEDKQRDLSSSMDTTMNSILKNNSLDFKKQNGPLISEIKSEKNLNKKYSLLKNLYKEDLKRDAIFGGKISRERELFKIKEKISYIEFQAKELDKTIKSNGENPEIRNQMKELNEKWHLLTSELEKLKGPDFFGNTNPEAEVQSLAGGEIDIISEGGKNDKSPESTEKRDEN